MKVFAIDLCSPATSMNRDKFSLSEPTKAVVSRSDRLVFEGDHSLKQIYFSYTCPGSVAKVIVPFGNLYSIIRLENAMNHCVSRT